MVDYKLKKDVVINGMPFLGGAIVSIPESMVEKLESKKQEKEKPIAKKQFKKSKVNKYED